MSIKYKGEATLLSIETSSFPDKESGQTITYHRARVAVDGEIYPCRSSEEQVREYKSLEGKVGVAEVEVVSRKEFISLRLNKFSAK